MLSKEQNQRLTQVEPGTPMGELLRRYWHPVAGVSELAETRIKPLRLMGEDFVLYQDLQGSYGLLGRHCPHRQADMAMGFVEQCGLRCAYHGWLFSADGACLEQPWEDTAYPNGRHKEKTRATAHRVKTMGGLVWAYIGPSPAPELPEYEPFTWKNGFVQIVISQIPCNWLQAQENSIDPVHFEWLHTNWNIRSSGMQDYCSRHTQIQFREIDAGFSYQRIYEDTDINHPLWKVGRVCIWPNAFFTGDHFEYRVPVDDANMLSRGWFFSRVPTENEPYAQLTIPTWHGPTHDGKGRWIRSHVLNQDFAAWAGQGRVANRTREHLGSSDRGVVMIRRQYFRDIEAVICGEDPKGVVRTVERARSIPLPVIDRDLICNGASREEMESERGVHMRYFRFQAGQPESVRRLQEQAMA